MSSIVISQLERFGPDRCERLSYEQASHYAQGLVKAQYENFSVVSWLLPRRLHVDFAHVYAFCRWADDLGDETGDRDRSTELLTWWRQELAACCGGEPRHPVYVALAQTMKRYEIPAKPFEDLIDAFEQDQRVSRYATWEQVLDYCTRSADPVGRLVLYLCGHRDEQRQRLSDATCTALQLVNFWQDVRRDIIERDRIYIPADMLGRHGLTHEDLVAHVRGTQMMTGEQMTACRAAVGELIERTWPLFRKGHGLWPLLERDIRLAIRLFSMGGEAVMRRIERMGYNTIQTRPRLSKATKARLMLHAAATRLAPELGRAGSSSS
jgi:squalene synthase HpnC